MSATVEAIPGLPGHVVSAAVEDRLLPLRRPLRGQRGPVTQRRVRLLRLRTDDGADGVGEASAVDWLAGTVAGPEAEAAATRLLDRIRSDRPAASSLLAWSLDADAPSSLRCALQTALLDAEATRRSVRLADLLAPGVAVAAELPLGALVGTDEPRRMAEEAAGLLRSGLRCLKVKVGHDGDLAQARAVREAVGPDVLLRLDANGAWRGDDATARLEGLLALHPDFVEEPLADPAAVAALGRADSIALDESVRSLADLQAALDRGGFGALVLKLERVGGPLPALAMADRARRAGLRVVFTDSIESDVGRAATLHVAAAEAARAGRDAEPVGLGGLFLLALLVDGNRPAASARVAGPGLGIDAAAGGNAP